MTKLTSVETIEDQFGNELGFTIHDDIWADITVDVNIKSVIDFLDDNDNFAEFASRLRNWQVEALLEELLSNADSEDEE